MTPYYACIPILVPKKIEKMMGVAEIVCGAGFTFGPMIGSIIYSIGGYNAPFILFGSASLIFSPITYFILTRN